MKKYGLNLKLQFKEVSNKIVSHKHLKVTSLKNNNDKSFIYTTHLLCVCLRSHHLYLQDQ